MAGDCVVFLREKSGEHGRSYSIDFEQAPQNEIEAERWARVMRPKEPGDMPIGFTRYGTYIPLK